MEFLKKENVKKIEISLFLLLFFQFLLLSFCNLTLIEENLDCDNAKLFRHVIEMWRQKTLIIPNWSYTTTLEYDCGTLIALPIYGFTQNIYLAFGISNIILTGLFISVIFFLFAGKDLIYPLFCSNLICIPFQTGMLDYFNMMFFGGSQYIIKVLTPLILVSILVFVENPKTNGWKNGKCIFFTLLYSFFFLLTCVSSGTYVALCGVIPIVLTYIIYKFLRWERVSSFVLVLFGTSGFSFFIGNALNTKIMGGTRGSSMVFTSVYQLLANVSSVFWGMFELFGGTTTETDARILSASGMDTLMKLCFVLLMLVCAVITLVKIIRKKADLRVTLLLALFIFNYFILNVANTRAGSATSEYRYHLIGMLPLICVTVITLVDGVRQLNKKQKSCLAAAAYVAILFLCATSYYQIIFAGEQNEDLKRLCTYCKEEDWDYVYLYEASNDSDICRVIDDSTTYLYVSEQGVVWTYDFYSCYVDATMQTENAIVAVDYTEYEVEDTLTIGNYRLQKFDTVGNRDLYRFV